MEFWLVVGLLLGMVLAWAAAAVLAALGVLSATQLRPGEAVRSMAQEEAEHH